MEETMKKLLTTLAFAALFTGENAMANFGRSENTLEMRESGAMEVNSPNTGDFRRYLNQGNLKAAEAWLVAHPKMLNSIEKFAKTVGDDIQKSCQQHKGNDLTTYHNLSVVCNQ